MCDYSLEHYHSRPAQQGEAYETHRFPSGSIGFVVPEAPSVAVCMTCDTRLKLENLPTPLQARLGVGAQEAVTFTRLDTGTYRDGVLFKNGRAVTLQELGSGVKAWVQDALIEPLPVFEPKVTVTPRRMPELVE
jgi:hypothetical protein